MLVSILITVGLIVFFAAMLYHVDSEKEPVRYVVWSVVTGFLAALLERFFVRYFILKLLPVHDLEMFAAILNDEYINISFIRAILSALVVGGLIKCLVKTVAFEWIAHRYDNEIDQPYDCIVYAVMLGLGYQLFESIIMLRGGHNTLTDNFYRVVSVFTHVLAGIAFGWCYARLYKFEGSLNRFGALCVGFLLAAIVHISIRLSFIWRQTLTSVVGIIVLIILCLWLGRWAHWLHRKSVEKYKVD